MDNDSRKRTFSVACSNGASTHDDSSIIDSSSVSEEKHPPAKLKAYVAIDIEVMSNVSGSQARFPKSTSSHSRVSVKDNPYTDTENPGATGNTDGGSKDLGFRGGDIPNDFQGAQYILAEEVPHPLSDVAAEVDSILS
jgi:hypothetical protein